MKNKWALVSVDDSRNLFLVRFGTLKEAREQMRKDVIAFLAEAWSEDESFEDYLKNAEGDEYGIEKTFAWVSICDFGWMDWQIFDLTKHIFKGGTHGKLQLAESR